MTDGLRKVCIVGFSYTTRDDAPFDDDSWEFWGCNRLHGIIEGRWARWFELHLPETLVDHGGEDHSEWLRSLSIPLYMQEHYDDYPTSVAYPLAEVKNRMVEQWNFPPEETDYFESTIAYQLALALLEGVDEIAIYGVDMCKDSEYEYQRPNLEGWIILARQQEALHGGNVKVHIPKNSALLKAATSGLYGYREGFGVLPPLAMKTFRDRLAAHEDDTRRAKEEMDRAAVKYHTHNGARQECEFTFERLQDINRGAKG